MAADAPGGRQASPRSIRCNSSTLCRNQCWRSTPQGAIREVNTAAEHFFDMPDARRCCARGWPTSCRSGRRSSNSSPTRSPARRPVNGYKLDVSTPRTGLGRLVDAFVSPLPRAEDGVMLLLQERSIAEKMDRQLTHRSAARSVTALGAMLAHEIKNPLSGIRGAAQLLEASASDEDRALTRLICEETDRIVNLVDRMESFSDERPGQRESLNIHQVLDHVKRLAQAGFAQHIRFVEVYDPSLPHVLGSRDALIQVFLNLVKNAAEAIGEESIDGEIMLSTAYRQGVRLKVGAGAEPVSLPLEICVRDNGPGVPADIAGQSVRTVRQLQILGLWPGTCTCRQSDRRPRRDHRVRVASAPHDVSRADAAGRAARGVRGRRRIAGVGRGRIGMSGRGRVHRTGGAGKELLDAVRAYSRRRRRRGDQDGSQSGAVARRLRGAFDRHGRRAVALGRRGRRGSRHHRRRHARRQRLRIAAAHQAHAAGSADHRHERAEHLHDRDQGLRARRLRIPAQTVRPEGAGVDRRPRARRRPSARAKPAPKRRRPRRCRWSAARRRCRTSSARWRD